MSTYRRPFGSITLICGSMFSGKTEELIRLVRRAMHARKRVQVFKSALETRCETAVISTHDGTRFNAIAVPDARTMEHLIAPDVQVVGIEEIQFFDEAIVPLCQRLADQGVQVIAAGLDQDFRGLPFGFMPVLMALADNVLKLHAICMICGEEASRTQRLVNGRPAAWDEPTILIGADESYEARCRRCHKVRNAPGVPRSILPGASATPTPQSQTESRVGSQRENQAGSRAKGSVESGPREDADRGTPTVRRARAVARTRDTEGPASANGRHADALLACDPGAQLEMFAETRSHIVQDEVQDKSAEDGKAEQDP